MTQREFPKCLNAIVLIFSVYPSFEKNGDCFKHSHGLLKKMYLISVVPSCFFLKGKSTLVETVWCVRCEMYFM